MYVSPLGAVNDDVPAILNAMVREARVAGDASVASTGWLSRSAAREWSNRVIHVITTVKDQLLKMKNGVPFYKRYPDLSRRFLVNAEKDVAEILGDLQKAKEDSLVQAFTSSNYKGIVQEYLRRAGTKIGEVTSVVVEAGADAALKSFKKSPALAVAAGIAGLFGVAYLWRSFK